MATTKTRKTAARKTRRKTAASAVEAFADRILRDFADDVDAVEQLEQVGKLQAKDETFAKKAARIVSRNEKRGIDDLDTLDDLSFEAEDWTPAAPELAGVYLKPANGTYPPLVGIRRTIDGRVTDEGRHVWGGPAVAHTLAAAIEDGSLLRVVQDVIKAAASDD